MDFGSILKEWEDSRGSRERDGRKPADATNGAAGKSGGSVPGKRTPRDAAATDAGKNAGSADSRRPEPGRRPAGARTSPGPSPEDIRRAQARWLEAHGTPDAGHREAEAGRGNRDAHPARRDLDRIPVDGALDLHGMNAEAAEFALERFFERAEAAGWRKVVIIHGKGLHSDDGPVLGEVARRWLERRDSAGRTGRADSQAGGSGATWVLLRGRDQRSR